MRPFLPLFAGFLVAWASAQEPITVERKVERLFLFEDIKGQVLSAGKVMSMFTPMRSRLAFQAKYTQTTSTFDFIKTRAGFVKVIREKFTPEEIDAIYDFRFRKCALLVDKQAKVRQDVACLDSALVLRFTTGSDDLGDFTIEEVPTGLQSGQLELAGELVRVMTDTADGPDQKFFIDTLVKQGMTKEQAQAESKAWDHRITRAKTHAYALRLSKADLEGLLAGYKDDRLGPLLLREEKIAGKVLSECLGQVFDKAIGEFNRRR
jgi:hypothetical protein